MTEQSAPASRSGTEAAIKSMQSASGQTIPPGGVPAGAEQTAKRTRAKSIPADTSKLTPEQKAKYDQFQAQVEASKAANKAAKRQMDELIGRKRQPRTDRQPFGGLNGNIVVTSVPNATGLKSEKDKAIAARLANGVKVADLAAVPGMSGNWFKYRLVRGSLKVGGLTLTEIVNRQFPQAQSEQAKPAAA